MIKSSSRAWPILTGLLLCGFKNTLIAGFTKDQCRPITGDVYDQPVQWTGKSWSGLKGKRVRLRFYLKKATLFSFWTRADRRVVGIQEVSQ